MHPNAVDAYYHVALTERLLNSKQSTKTSPMSPELFGRPDNRDSRIVYYRVDYVEAGDEENCEGPLRLRPGVRNS